jgi:hypothetical protein
MAWTQADIDALDEAIKNGVTLVSFQDRQVRYRSMDELLKARALAVIEVKASEGKTTTRHIRVYTDKGW